MCEWWIYCTWVYMRNYDGNYLHCESLLYKSKNSYFKVLYFSYATFLKFKFKAKFNVYFCISCSLPRIMQYMLLVIWESMMVDSNISNQFWSNTGASKVWSRFGPWLKKTSETLGLKDCII